MSDATVNGWAALADVKETNRTRETQEIEVAFSRCFSGEDGRKALEHLREITMERALGPSASDTALRHLDGQRCLVLHIQSLIDRGRGG